MKNFFLPLLTVAVLTACSPQEGRVVVATADAGIATYKAITKCADLSEGVATWNNKGEPLSAEQEAARSEAWAINKCDQKNAAAIAKTDLAVGALEAAQAAEGQK